MLTGFVQQGPTPGKVGSGRTLEASRRDRGTQSSPGPCGLAPTACFSGSSTPPQDKIRHTLLLEDAIRCHRRHLGRATDPGAKHDEERPQIETAGGRVREHWMPEDRLQFVLRGGQVGWLPVHLSARVDAGSFGGIGFDVPVVGGPSRNARQVGQPLHVDRLGYQGRKGCRKLSVRLAGLRQRETPKAHRVTVRRFEESLLVLTTFFLVVDFGVVCAPLNSLNIRAPRSALLQGSKAIAAMSRWARGPPCARHSQQIRSALQLHRLPVFPAPEVEPCWNRCFDRSAGCLHPLTASKPHVQDRPRPTQTGSARLPRMFCLHSMLPEHRTVAAYVAQPRLQGLSARSRIYGKKGERLDNDPNGSRYGCFLPDLTGLARRLPAPTSRGVI